MLEKFKRFSKELVHGFSITKKAARIALVTYNDEAKLNMDFGRGQNSRAVERNINDIKMMMASEDKENGVQPRKIERNLVEALRFTKENVFSLKGGLRKVNFQNFPHT